MLDGSWRKAAGSAGKGACVEARLTTFPPDYDNWVSVRHSKDPDHVLNYTPTEWAAFLTGVRAGEFDLQP